MPGRWSQAGGGRLGLGLSLQLRSLPMMDDGEGELSIIHNYDNCPLLWHFRLVNYDKLPRYVLHSH